MSEGQHIRAVWNDRIIGAKVTKASYIRNYAGGYMLINAQVIDSGLHKFIYYYYFFFIPIWII